MTNAAAAFAALQAENAELRALVVGLQTRIAELERQLGLDSSNSGKPPVQRRAQKEAVAGAQPARAFGQEERRPEGPSRRDPAAGREPDTSIDHRPTACSNCGASLEHAASTGYTARQVFDLPEPQPLIVTEHRAHVCCCAECGVQTRGQFPDDATAPVQYGPRIGAVAVISPPPSSCRTPSSCRRTGSPPQ